MAQEIKIQLKIEGLDVTQKNVKLLSSSIETLSDVSKQTQKNLSGISSTLNSVKGAFNSVIDTVFSLQGLLVGLAGGLSFGKAISEAIAQEEAINSLNVALQITGRYTDKTSQSLQDFATQLQKTTRYSDDAILNTTTLIQTLGDLDEQGLKKATEAAINMAAALKIDLNTAATLVGKAAVGEIGTFSRYGVVIQKGADNAQTFARTLDVLNSKFGGSATGQVNTFAGAFDQLKNTFGDLLEEIGNLIIKNPFVIDSLKSITRTVQGLIESFLKTKEEIRAFAISTLEAFLTWGDTINAIVNGIKSTIATVFVAALAYAGIAVYTFAKTITISFAEIQLITGLALAKASTALTAFTTAMKVAQIGATLLKATLTLGLTLALDYLIYKSLELKETLGGWTNAFNSVFNSIKIGFYELSIIFIEFSKDFRETIFNSFTFFVDQFNKVRRLIGKEDLKVSFIENIKEDAEDAAKVIKNLNQKIVDLAAANAKSVSDNAKKNGDFFGKSFAESALKSLKGLPAKISENLQVEKIKVGLDKDALNRLVSDFTKVRDQLTGLEKGDLGRIQSLYNEQKKVILDAYKYRIQLADGTVVNEVMKNKLLLANDNEYFAKLAQLQKKEAELRRKIVDDAISSVRDPIKSAFTDITEGMDDLAKKKFAPQIKVAIETNILGIALGFVEALKSGASGLLSTMANFASNILDPEKAKVLFGKLEEVLPKFVEGLRQFTDKIPGIVGQIIGIIPALLQIFGQAPELFRKMISDSITGIPEIIGNIIVNIAETFSGKFIDKVIVGFINNIPMLVESIVYAIVTLFSSPVFWIRIVLAAVNAFIRAIPRIIQGFIDGFTKGFADLWKGFADLGNLLGQIGSALWAVLAGIWNALGSIVGFLWDAFSDFGGIILEAAWDFFDTIILGAVRFIDELVSKIPVVGNMLSGSGSSSGIPIVGGIFESFGFAEGGMVKKVPSGYPSDTYPARLTSNELIVDTSTTKRLQDFLANQSQPQSTGQQVSNSLLVKIMDLLERPMVVESSIQLNQKTFADIILSLNRTNQRLA